MSWLIEQYRRSAAARDKLGMYRLSPNSYYVGDPWVGVILVTTDDGIVMLDSGIAGHLDFIFDSIKKLGYDPQKDIKLCLLSHCHSDHCSGMARLRREAAPIVYMSALERDWPGTPDCYAGLPADIDPVVPFAADRFYTYDAPICCGGFSFRAVHTPGHSPGTTSFFFEDKAPDGTVYRVGFHGGMGINTLQDSCFADVQAALSARAAYRSSMESLLEEPVDITVTNHGGNIALLDRAGEDWTDYRSFIDPAFWKKHLQNKLNAFDAMTANSIYR